MDDVELLLRRYGDDLDEQCPPVTLAELERHLESAAEESSAIGLGLADDAAADGGGDRDRRLMVLAAAVVVLLAATVAVVVAVVAGDEDSNRVITEQPDTPVTIETPATTVAPSVTEAPSPTTEVPPPTASPAVAEWGRAPFAPPPEYGEPFGTLSCCVATEDYQFTLLSSPGDRFADGDLLIMTLPQGGVPNVTEPSYAGFPNGAAHIYLGFTGDLRWAEGSFGSVVLASRSYTTDQLVTVADSLEIDESTGRFVAPEGFVPIADQGYDHWLGPLSSTELRLDPVKLAPEPSDHLEYRSTWTTGGGGVGEIIYVKATTASDGVLELVEYLVEDTQRVQVRGSTGVLGTYGGSQQLSWIEDDTALVTITATDPSVDLLAMAESNPPEPWSPGPDQTVLSGTHEGVDWNLIVRPNAVYGFQACLELLRDEAPILPDGTPSCSNLGVVTFPAKPMPAPTGLFVGGRAPDCATEVKIPPHGGSGTPSVSVIPPHGGSGIQSVSVDTVLAADGHRYFGVWIPFDAYSRPLVGAIDGAGATVGTYDIGGWASDDC